MSDETPTPKVKEERSELHRLVIAQLEAATKNEWPMPHFHAENVFPADVYDGILAKLDAKTNYEAVNGKYANRMFSNTEDFPEFDFMLSKLWFKDVLMLFPRQAQLAFGDTKQQFTRDLRLIRDSRDYKIGPHTDTRFKVVSLLFYLPRDESMLQFGTRLYKPKAGFMREQDPDWRRHYEFRDFHEVGAIPFVPNACFGFWRTNKSWHGVPAIPNDVRRDVLLYNIYVPEVPTGK